MHRMGDFYREIPPVFSQNIALHQNPPSLHHHWKSCCCLRSYHLRDHCNGFEDSGPLAAYFAGDTLTPVEVGFKYRNQILSLFAVLSCATYIV